ncbi:MAG TPA: restriction endonuclease [Longimicrobium sp.]|nr:restriction endonuclease [Longimicrobium sp.]
MAAEKITLDRVGEMIKIIFSELKQMGGVAPVRQLLERAEPKLNLSEYERGRHAKTGAVRWETAVRWYTVDCTRAGYLRKEGGKWYLTEEGERALSLPAGELIRTAGRAYREWKKGQPVASRGGETREPEADAAPSEGAARQAIYEQAVEQARAEIEDRINSLGPYQFQDLVGALLEGMGYYVPHIASPGRDGGIDLIAYRDPLGTTAPRIKVQVKHRDQKLTVKEVRELEGLLRKEGDIGLLVSSGGFTSEVEREIRSSGKHIELMDLDRLITLWQQHYEQIPESKRALLPLVRVFFLAPVEA